MPLYITTNVAIKEKFQVLIQFANASGNNDLKNNNSELIFHLHNLDKFKEIIEKHCGKTLVQNTLHPEQIIGDDSKTLIIVPASGFWPLELFHDPNLEEYKFPMLFYGNPRFTCSYKKNTTWINKC